MGCPLRQPLEAALGGDTLVLAVDPNGLHLPVEGSSTTQQNISPGNVSASVGCIEIGENTGRKDDQEFQLNWRGGQESGWKRT